jgi:hypothetical protein
MDRLMTTDRTAAPSRPSVAARAASQDRHPAAVGFADLLGGAHAASGRPAARAASQRREDASEPQIRPAPAEFPFVLTVSAPPIAAPAQVPVTVAPAVPAEKPAGVPTPPSPRGAVAASLRAPAPALPAVPAVPAPHPAA